MEDNQNQTAPVTTPPVEQTPPTPPTESEPQKKKKPVLLIIAVVVFFLVLFSALYVSFAIINATGTAPAQTSPSPAPVSKTEEWKTYDNAELGIQFNYPLGSELTENPNEVIFKKTLDGENCINGQDCVDVLNLKITKSKAKPSDTLESIANAWLVNEYDTSENAVLSYETLGGQKTLKNIPGMCGAEYFILINGSYYVLAEGHCSEQTGDVLSQILSTFKFTGQDKSTTDTSCKVDTDCMLTNYDPCPNNKCQDYSKAEWVSVNGKAYMASTTPTACTLQAPVCSPSLEANNARYSAKCVDNTCQKVKN